MNKNDFIKLINILVEKKLNEILPGMIEAEVKKQTQSGIRPDIDDFESDDDLKSLILNPHTSTPIIRDNTQKKQIKTENKQFSKNPVINKILNETAKDFTPLAKDPTDPMSGGSYQRLLESEYENVSDEFTFNTKNMTNAINRTQPQPKHIAQENLKNQLLNQPDAKPEIVNAMVKDYSKLLKTIDKKAKSTRGGGIRPISGIGENW